MWKITVGWDEKGRECIQNFARKRFGKHLLERLRRIWWGNIKMEPGEMDSRMGGRWNWLTNREEKVKLSL
jgi:hypothetical protein